jgi:hypothetical protein
MKTQGIYYWFVLIAICFISRLEAQEFVLKLRIEDSLGNRDTLEIGYDAMASDSLDENLGEVNIKDQEWNGEFDVRFTNIWDDGIFNGPELQTKRWIGKLSCEDWKRNMLIKLDVMTRGWPVTVRWDSTRMQNECLNYSVMTDKWVMNWFDVSSANNIVRCMGGEGTGEFDRHESLDDDHVRVEEGTGDTIFFIYIGLGNELARNSTTTPSERCKLRTGVIDISDEIEIRGECIVYVGGGTEEVSIREYNVLGQRVGEGHLGRNKYCLRGEHGIRIIEIEKRGQRLLKKIIVK